jgi:hypothetical protein
LAVRFLQHEGLVGLGGPRGSRTWHYHLLWG